MGTRWIATLDIEDPMSCLLKERRISRDGRPAWDLCGVPSERTDFTTRSQGFTLGWYAMPRWGMGPKDNPDAGEAPSQYGTDGDTRCRRCLVGIWNRHRIGHGNGVLGAPKGHCIPAQGATLGLKDPMSRVLKERRISRDGRPAWDLCGVPSERTDFTTCSQGFTLGWYAMPRWGMGPKDNPDAGDARPNMESTTTPMEAMPRWGMEPMTNISQAMPVPIWIRRRHPWRRCLVGAWDR